MAAPTAVLCAMVLAGMTTACEGAKTNVHFMMQNNNCTKDETGPVQE